MIKIIYNSPAVPQEPYNVNLKEKYDCMKNGDKYLVKGLDFEREFSLDFIKRMFKPCDGYSWDILDNENKKENKTKKSKSNNEKLDINKIK
jgi:hypothetical protein